MLANPIVTENAIEGTTAWQLESPATGREIEGYASLTSVDRNDAKGIDFCVSTAIEEEYTVEVFRMGWYAGLGARLLYGPVVLQGFTQPTPPRDPHMGTFDCDWQTSLTLRAAEFSTWVSGIYLVRLSGSTSGRQSYCIFVLRDDASEAALVFQSSVTTFQAYNEWPGDPDGMSIYAPGGTETTGAAALKVSFNRPYGVTRLGSAFALGQPYNVNAVKGLGAGEFLTNLSSDRFTMAGGWEYNLVRFLEREGYDVCYTTSLDTHRAGADRLLQHRGFISVGHDEYWTWEMRDAVEGARDRGLNLAFFSSNTCYWQARLEPSGNSRGQDDRILVVYKNDIAPERVDFLTGEGDLFLPVDHRTILWAHTGRPDAALTGVSVFNAPSGGPGDFYSADLVVADPSSFVFFGTGLGNGDTVRGVVGMETDAIQPTSPLGATLIARSPIASGPPSDMVAYTTLVGSTVVTTDSMQWSWGLDDFDVSGTRPAFASEQLRTATRNVLERLQTSGNHIDSLVTYGVLPDELDGSRWALGAVCEGPPSDAVVVEPPGPEGLVVVPAAGTAGFGGVVSASAWDLRGKQIRVQAADTAAAVSDTFMSLTSDGDNWRRIIREDDLIYFQAADDGQRVWLSASFSADDDLWWQLRHHLPTDSLIYETSPDGVAWRYRWEFPAPRWLDESVVELQSGTLGPVADPGIARFRSFAVEPSAPRPDPAEFADDFSAAVRDEERWVIGVLSTGPGEGSGSVTQGAGSLIIHPPQRSKRPTTSDPTVFIDGPNYTGYVTRDAFSLVHVAASVKVVDTCGGAQGTTIVGAAADADNWIRFRLSGGDLVLEFADDGNVTSAQIKYDAAAHRWWRLSHIPGWLAYETSADGHTWTEQHRVGQPTWVDGVQVELQAGSEVSDESVTAATFASLVVGHR